MLVRLGPLGIACAFVNLVSISSLATAQTVSSGADSTASSADAALPAVQVVAGSASASYNPTTSSGATRTSTDLREFFAND